MFGDTISTVLHNMELEDFITLNLGGKPLNADRLLLSGKLLWIVDTVCLNCMKSSTTSFNFIVKPQC